ncbi:MAG: DUF262 domain-containing protein [Clostridiales Family XIII bacterium]|jgi:phage-related protein|nr:DUF262 domain-containing protein [Clostridiales Family XIII bacterium]
MTNNIDPKPTTPLRLLKGTFILPRYQRGYRWTEVQVKDLLDDLHTFVQEKRDLKSFYFLQPLVVCKSSLGDQNFEVIDGQQRLITISLIDTALCNIEKRQSRLEFALKFEARPESEALLKELKDNPNTNLEYDINEGIEHYYIRQAATTINKYFTDLKNKDEDLDDFYSKFTSYVDFLWHLVEYTDSIESASHFIRLNMGRISLTSAELCRAILLNPAKHKPNNLNIFPVASDSTNYDENAQKVINSQFVYRRQIVIGNQWDDLERGLRKPEFWAFLGSDEHDLKETRIDLILDLYTKTVKKTDGFASFRKLEDILKSNKEKDALEIWDEITQVYKTLVSWYDNHDYYHWIGFMVRQGSNAVSTLNNFLEDAKVEKKSRFVKLIKEKISNIISLDVEIEDVVDQYHADIVNLLFFFNVEYARQMQTYDTNNLPDEYKQRFAFGLNRRESWTIEHIEAQNVEPFNNRKQWNLWIKEHSNALLSIKTKIDQYDNIPKKEKIIKSIEKINTDCTDFLNDERNTIEKSQQLIDRILEVIEKLRTIDNAVDEKLKFNKDGLGNLALMDKSLNSHLKNSIFLVKQEKILKLINEGKYIPKSIEAIFMRYFNDKTIILPYWSSEDYVNYFKQIKKTFDSFKKDNNDT